MTNLTLFVEDAIKTESSVDKIIANRELLCTTITILINAGNILDQIKKNVFYEKAYDIEQLIQHVDKLHEDVAILSNISSDAIIKDKQTFNVNPRIFHSIVGIATESTELLEALDLYSKDLDVVNMAEEFGDIDWYKAIGADEINIPWDTILDTVINKLKIRFPNAFTNEDAINRTLDDERELLDKMETRATPRNDT